MGLTKLTCVYHNSCRKVAINKVTHDGSGTYIPVCVSHTTIYVDCGYKLVGQMPGVKVVPTKTKKAYKQKCEDGCGKVATQIVKYDKTLGYVCDTHKRTWVREYGWKPLKTMAAHNKELAKKAKAKEVIKNMQWWKILEQLSTVSGRIMLVGPPGTGKSQTAFLLLGNAQRITMTEGTAVEDLLGMFHLVKGETIWKDGPAARAMRSGTALILDEIDKYSPEVGSLLYALLDDDPQVTLPSGEHLKAKDGYKVIATSNANVSALPEAILDRMEAVLVAATPHPDAMSKLRDAEKAAVHSHYEKKVDAKAWQWTGAATLRRMRAFSKFRKELKEGLPEVIVAEVTFGKNGNEILSVLATASRTGKEGL